MLYHYYCGDVSAYLNNKWLPVVVWFLVNIVPHIVLSITIFIITIKSSCLLTSCSSPILILSGIFSHLHVGPVNYTKSNSGCLCFSKTFSYINIFLSFTGMCFHIHMITAQFGAGDSSQLQVVIPIIICVPMFTISAFLTICFMHCFCCCDVKTELFIFNPSDPGKLYVMDNDRKVVPIEEKHEMIESI